MTFLHPWMLWGALGAALPLLIHLWGRRRPRRVLFPSIRLIRVGQQQQPSLSRLRELLVLLLRMAMIIILSLALAGPQAEWPWLARLAPPQEKVAVVLDRSASMSYRTRDGTSFDRARRAAQTIIEHLPSGHEAAIFTVDCSLQRLAGDAAGLGHAAAGQQRGELIAALDRATEPEIWDSHTRVFLLTDLQESSLRGQLGQPLPQPPVIVDVGPKHPANHAITDVVARTPCPLRGRPLELEVSVRTWGGAGVATEQRVLELGAEVEGRGVPGCTIPAQPGTHRTRLRLRPQTGGEMAVSLTLPPDAFPLDDRWHAVVGVRGRLRVMVVTGGSSPRFAALALNPGGEGATAVDVLLARWGSVPPAARQVDVVIATDVPATQEAEQFVQALVRQQRGLVLFTGPDTRLSAAALQALLGANVTLGGVVAAPGDEPLALAEVTTTRLPLEPFANARAGNLLELRFTRRREIQGADGARVLARFTDGAPAIVGTRDPERRCILVNTSLDQRWTNAPVCAVYVPLLHHLCYDVAGAPRRVWPDWWVGETMHIQAPPTAGGTVTVRGPMGAAEVKTQAGQWQFTPTVAGLYEATWREKGGQNSARFAVNVNPMESDFTRIAHSEVRRRLKAPHAVVLRPQDLASYLKRRGAGVVSLVYPLLVIAMLMLAAETFVTAPRRQLGGQEGVGT